MDFLEVVAHPPVTRTFIQFPNDGVISVPLASKSDSVAMFRACRQQLKHEDIYSDSGSESDFEGSFDRNFLDLKLLQTPKFDDEQVNFFCFLEDLGEVGDVGDMGDESCFDSLAVDDFGGADSQSTFASVQDVPVRHTFVQISNGIPDLRRIKSETLRRQCSREISDVSAVQKDRDSVNDAPRDECDIDVAIENLVCLPSKGSAKHGTGDCKPCGFFHNEKKGCIEKENCRFCHLCGPQERKRRRAQKAETMRIRRQMASSCGLS